MNPSRYALFIPQIASFLLMAPLSALAETPISFHGLGLKRKPVHFKPPHGIKLLDV